MEKRWKDNTSSVRTNVENRGNFETVQLLGNEIITFNIQLTFFASNMASNWENSTS